MRKFFLLPIITILTACFSDGAGVIQTPDNTKIDLGLTPQGWVTVQTNSGSATGYNQKDSFYGGWVDDSKQMTELSYQGNQATNIPQTGKATYFGNVVRVATDGDIINAGTSRLNVDFGQKKVDGYLDLDLARDITLKEGRLNGAEFSGQATMLFNNKGRYTGSLMGNGATEAVGLVDFDDAQLNAAFGGKRY